MAHLWRKGGFGAENSPEASCSVRLLLPLLPLVLICVSATAAGFGVKNGFIDVGGKDGVITSLRFDPSGKGSYGRNHIIGLAIGNTLPDPDAEPELDSSGRSLTIRNAKIAIPGKVEQLGFNHPEQLLPGHTLGQRFKVGAGVLQSAAAFVPTYTTSDSALTITLYRLDASARTVVASRRVENLKDNDWVELTFADQPAGEYELELSDVRGMAGWWSNGKSTVDGGALADRAALPNVDRCFRCKTMLISRGDFEIKLDGNRLRTKYTPLDGAPPASELQTNLVLPWAKSGYDTTSDSIIFHHFLTEGGLYMPVHQFKRRPWSNVSGLWVLMSGRFGTDLRFTNAPIHLRFDEDRMTMVFPGGEREIEVLPHTDELPDGFPRFFSSKPDVDRVLNDFLLSHNFNFGVGTNPEWKEWHTLQMSWTANGQCDWQHAQFDLEDRMDPNGYVYCWGTDPGWPFPFKDDDKDGKNDYDTRHFTTNPCYILGAWREYCWTRDREFLVKTLPKVRLAMKFMLEDLDGKSGILTINAPWHEGKDGSIGSNYWDILPFGWKSAFENAYFYPCLEAMAQLEEEALGNVECGPSTELRMGNGECPARTPRFYRRLAEKVRETYNKTFWLADKGRYASCLDKDGVMHDYGHTFVNLTAMGYDLADPEQVKRVYDWMENGVSASGKRDIYSRWKFAPRAGTIRNPRRTEPQSPAPSWWSMSWGGTDYDEQCQDGGAILYTSYYDIIARARYFGADNAWQRFTEILDRYGRPDHLSGGSPLYYGEITQGGPGGTAGSVGVEGEFPENGMVPVSFLYAFLGIDADIHGIKIRPNLPSALSHAGVRNVRFGGMMYDIRVTNTSVELKCTTPGQEKVIKKDLKPGEAARYGE